MIQRSDDGGRTWEAVDNQFVYDGVPGTHQWYDGTQHPVGVQAGLAHGARSTMPDTVYAGAEDAAIFRSTDGGKAWHELPDCAATERARSGSPVAGGMCLHTILFDPTNPKRIYVAISAAGRFRTDDGGATWKPINRGLKSPYLPEPTPEIGFCVHRLALHPSRPDVVFMQLHQGGGVYRSDNAADQWVEVNGNLPTDFGFPIDVHAHEADTVYAVPMDPNLRVPPEGSCACTAAAPAATTGKPLTRGLPQENCYVNVLRDAMAVDSLDPCGIYFGTTGGQVYGSADLGNTWETLVRDLPAVLSVEVL